MRRWSRAAALAAVAVVAMATATLAVASHEPSTSTVEDPGTRLAVAWYELQLDLIRETAGFSPPVAARALGYTGVALWEAVAPASAGGRSLAGQLNGFAGAPPPGGPIDPRLAANRALADTLRALYPNALAVHLHAVDRLEASLGEDARAAVDNATAERSERHGAAVAEAVLAWAREDGGHEGHLAGFGGIPAPTGPASWVPTPRPSGPPFPPLLPWWGENRPMLLPGAEACTAAPPHPYSEDVGTPFYEEAREVYDAVRGLSDEQRRIALFWADAPGTSSTPAGHWVAILNDLASERHLPLPMVAEAYARLGIAANDAFISCWSTKYRHDLLRPITYIRRVIDPGWNAEALTDPVTTPPFPEYTSGHSVLSAAAASALTDVLGELAFTDRTHEAQGWPARSFGSFEEAAAEAAISRLYGGIHYRSSIERGLEQGRCVGERVAGLRFGW